MKRITTEEFIKKSKKIHGDKYDYSLVEYVDSKTKVKIICPIHGVFEQKSNQHYRTNGCPKCSNIKTSNIFRSNLNDIINKFKNIHGDKYDYSLVYYINYNTKVKIICKKHGEFEQTPKTHIKKHGCKKCYNEKLSKILLDDKEKFIKKSKKIHGNKYDYSLVEYINARTKVKIICPFHNIFKQIPYIHTQGSGCPHCNESKGEREIKKLLEQNNIKYISQKRFNKCRNINPLPFDFYLPDYNICIEFDGEQHFKPLIIWGGETEFKKIIKKDNIKNKFCIDNNIKLIRIKYTENILKKLTNSGVF